MAINPIAYTEKVVSNFLKYQLTAYPFADPDLREQMKRLLSLDATRRTPLMKGPYISLSRVFTTGAAIKDLATEGLLHPHLNNLVDHPHLYGHQEKAVRAIQGGHPTLVSTGTGSGKTECFLYPIISHCLRLRDENAPAGISAVIIYPMNALAEDQLGRLRELLAGSGITFGLYVGKTPENAVSGDRPAIQSREDYRKALAKAQAEKRDAAVHPPEERCTREEMRTPGKQPRILLTNVKQLELLLTRQADIELFANARLDFLVCDEAHTYSGVGGAETACLIRRLRAFCGKTTEQTVCIGTSATIADPRTSLDPARKFMARFFGVKENAVEVVTEQYENQVWAEKRTVNPPLGSDPAAVLKDTLASLDAVNAGERIAAIAKSLLGANIDPAKWEEGLYACLAANEVAFQLAEYLKSPKLLADLVIELEKRVGRPVPDEEVLICLALAAAARNDGRPLLRPVVHVYVRGIRGAVVSFPADKDRPQLWLSAEDEEAKRKKDEPVVRLPVMSCSTCGQHYFIHHVADFEFDGDAPGGGEAIEDRTVWKSLDSVHGGTRVVLVDKLLSNDGEEEDEAPAHTSAVYLCRCCGALHPTALNRCDSCGTQGKLVPMLVIDQQEENEGFLTRCVSCGALGRNSGGSYREPARPVRANTVSDVHVLAQDMLHNAERKRLLVFADNRQDAAFQAGWMRDHARRFRLRALMSERIKLSSVSVGDLVAHLDQLLDSDDDVSRALLPEVWEVCRKDGSETEHANERKYYLRIMVLREIVTAIKQRVGLEPWGRLKVEYKGVNPSSTFVQKHAAQMGLTPERLADGIGGLLDILRRNAHVLDQERQIFSKYWQEGDREIQRGYLPIMRGVPKGLKLRRGAQDDKGRVTQWLSTHETLVRQVVKKWNLAPEAVDPFIEELWQHLEDLKVLAPVTLTGSKNRALPNCGGTYQLDADKMLLTANKGLWRCKKCRRTQVRPAPFDKCIAWRCTGDLVYEDESADSYDLAILDQNVQMIRPREHSAQVRAEERELLERMFKGTSEAVNTLVCTPTLELGLDIGPLEVVLMRNVPPLPANYWQRAGRAGRRNRMAVNFAYCRPTSHDRAYFNEPNRMLDGIVEPPSFNMRNALMVAKHIHAAILTRLNQLEKGAAGLSQTQREEIAVILKTVFPRQIREYLFEVNGNLRHDVFDVSSLNTLISVHEDALLAYVRTIFEQEWPWEEKDIVTPDILKQHIQDTTDQLQAVVRTLKKRLDWALGQMHRLDATRKQKGTLEPDEDALYQRCDRLVKRYKGQTPKRKNEAEGHDDINTFNVLSAEGFLPGYGLDIGSIVGTALVPRHLLGRDFDLPRPPSIALREYVPGNLIYANGHRFVSRYFHLQPEEQPTQFQVDVEHQAVKELGKSQTASALSGTTLRAVPICDVELSHVSHIADDEDYRFQLMVATYGYELGRHGVGRAFNWGPKPCLLRRGVHFRLVNVGATKLLDKPDRRGYPVCLVCGQSRSPFASKAERDNFKLDHETRHGGKPVDNIGFFSDVVADALTIPDCENQSEAFSLAEALRTGAARVLDMDREDLDVLVIGRSGSERADAVLFDPMPGGSGLLDQICLRFNEVVKSMRDVVESCPSACVSSCIDCLQTFRNGFFHRFLDRHVAIDRINDWGGNLTFSHDIPPKLPALPPKNEEIPVNAAEAALHSMLNNAGFPAAQWHKQIDLGKPLGSTTPDCFFPDEDGGDRGTCVYLDGLSAHLHGNPATQQRDQKIREHLRMDGYEVIEIPASQLSDQGAMSKHFYRLGRLILGKDKAKDLRDNPKWFAWKSNG